MASESVSTITLKKRIMQFLDCSAMKGNVKMVDLYKKKLKPLKEFLMHLDNAILMEQKKKSKRDLKGRPASEYIAEGIRKCVENLTDEQSAEVEAILYQFVISFLSQEDDAAAENQVHAPVINNENDHGQSEDDADAVFGNTSAPSDPDPVRRTGIGMSSSSNESREADIKGVLPILRVACSCNCVKQEHSAADNMGDDNENVISCINQNITFEEKPNVENIPIVNVNSSDIRMTDWPPTSPANSTFAPKFSSTPAAASSTKTHDTEGQGPPSPDKNLDNSLKRRVSDTTAASTDLGSPKLRILETDIKLACPAGEIKLEATHTEISEPKIGALPSNSALTSSDPASTQTKLSLSDRNMTYKEVMAECANHPQIAEVSFERIRIDHAELVRKRTRKPLPLCHLPKIRDFILRASLKSAGKGNQVLLKTLPNLNLEDWIFFYKQNSDSSEGRLSELWSHSVAATFELNEITLLETIPEKGRLTLNFTETSSFFRLGSQNLVGLTRLSLANCEIVQEQWLTPDIARQLKTLILYNVRSLKINKSLELCTSLENLVLWPVKRQTPTLRLDNVCKKLKALAVSNHVINYEENSQNCVFPYLKSFVLQECTWDVVLVQNFKSIFPNVVGAFVRNVLRDPPSDILKALMTIDTVKEIVGLNFNSKSELTDKELGAFLKKVGIREKLNECHFKLTRTGKKNREWNGDNIKKSEFAELLFQYFNLRQFYSLDSWKMYFWPEYEDC